MSKFLWPEAVSDGLTLSCHDCGQIPRFDYRVRDGFWAHHVPGAERTSVVCLPCLDRRCGGVGLMEALQEVQWTGTGHTVVLRPALYVPHDGGDVMCGHGKALDMHCCECQRRGFFPPEDCTCFQ